MIILNARYSALIICRKSIGEWLRRNWAKKTLILNLWTLCSGGLSIVTRKETSDILPSSRILGRTNSVVRPRCSFTNLCRKIIILIIRGWGICLRSCLTLTTRRLTSIQTRMCCYFMSITLSLIWSVSW